MKHADSYEILKGEYVRNTHYANVRKYTLSALRPRCKGMKWIFAQRAWEQRGRELRALPMVVYGKKFRARKYVKYRKQRGIWALRKLMQVKKAKESSCCEADNVTG